MGISDGTRLLAQVSGSVGGRVLGVIGATGAGKSTLLNALAHRLKGATVTRGDITIDGNAYGTAELKAISGYVMKDDVLFGHMTVRETLEFAARLKMDPGNSPAQRTSRVEEVMALLQLTKCADTVVGDSFKKGISGGERKRLCVGVELVAIPRILFFDEPTTGLDSVVAVSLMQTLKHLAWDQGVTVIAALQSPTSRIFFALDEVMVLHHGAVVFHGTPPELVERLAQVGSPCPADSNPADHALIVIDSLVAGSEGEEEALSSARDFGVADDAEVGGLATAVAEVRRPRWISQFAALFSRSLKITTRNHVAIAVQLFQALLMGVLVGTAFLRIGTSQSSITRRQPLLFFCCVNQAIFAPLLAANSFPSERAIILRERAGGAYHVSAYFVAKMAAEMLVQLAYPFCFAITVYFVAGLQADASHFFTFLLFMELCALAATSLAIMIATITRHVDLTMTFLPFALEVARLFGGYFLSPKNLPAYFSWLDALSVIKYAYVGVALNELHGLTLHCTPQQLVGGVCPVTSGQPTIDSLGLAFITIPQCAGALIAMIVGFRAIGYLALRYRK